jgi:intein/homing endonuclease
MNGGRSKGSLTYHLVIIDAKALYKLVEPYIIKKKDELKALAEVGDRVHAKIIRRVGDYIALRVKKVENTNEEDYFYDLVSSEDFTYLVNGIVSSNSHAIFT